MSLPFLLGFASRPLAASEVVLGPSNGYTPLLLSADGHLESFAGSSDGIIYHTDQPSWPAWSSLAGPTRMQGQPVAALDANGIGVAFAVTVDGQLDYTFQPSWPAWAPLGNQGSVRFAGQPAVTRNGDGRLEVFVRSTDGSYWHAWQSIPAGPWSGWWSLGGAFRSDPTVIQNADGRAELFGVSTSTQPYHMWQNASPASGWSGWWGLGGSVQSKLTAIRNQDGHLEIFGVAFNNSLYHDWQTPTGAWSGWWSLGGGILGGAAVVVNSSGVPQAFVRGGDAGVWQSYRNPDGSWSGWGSLGGYVTGDPQVTAEPDGTVSLWVPQYSTWYENDGTTLTSWSSWQSRGTLPAGFAPPTAWSWYVLTTDPATAENLGVNQGHADAADGSNSEVILDFGGQDSNAPDGTTLVGNVGTASMAQIESVAESFAKGYYEATGPNDSTTILRLGVGTNNSLYSVSYQGGQVWSALVNTISGWVQQQGFASQVVVVGANDIESWGDPTGTLSWAQGYQAEGGRFINYGSADGCPPAGQQCNSGWTQGEYYEVSWGNPAAEAVPEIYYEPNALQWQAISLWGVSAGGSPIQFDGPLDEAGSNSSCSSSLQPFTATAAWDCFTGALLGDSRTQVTMSFSDEIHSE